jgi:outer membrane protein TolC
MKQIIKYFLIWLCPLGLEAQEAVPFLTLDTILKRIEKNNLMLQSYQLQKESFKYKAEAATAWMAPMVGLGTFMTPYPGEKNIDASDKGNIMLQLEQEIPNAAKIRARKNFILSQGDVSTTERQIAYNELSAQAKRYYYSWLIAKNRIQVLRENERLMNTMKKIEEVRYPYNKSQLSGVYTVTSRIEENRNMIRMQEGNIQRARAMLLTLMNREKDELFEIDSIAETHFVPSEVYDTAVIAESRKDVLKMNQNIRSMQLNIISMKQEKKPDFRVRFDHMSPLSNMMPNAFNVMGMISIPIAPWSSRMYKSEIKAMEYSIESMKKQRQGMLQETKGMLNGMRAEIQSMHDRVVSMEEKIIPALKKALDANYISYQENKLQLAEVIDSWEALNMMQMNILEEKLKHYEMIVEYERQLFQ